MEKKKRKRGKKLNLLGLEDSGPQFFSPSKVQTAREFQALKEENEIIKRQEIEERKAQKAAKKQQKEEEKAQRQAAAAKKRRITEEVRSTKAAERLTQQELRETTRREKAEQERLRKESIEARKTTTTRKRVIKKPESTIPSIGDLTARPVRDARLGSIVEPIISANTITAFFRYRINP